MAETLIFEDDIGTAYEDEPSVDPDDATVVLAEQTLTFNGTDQLIIELSSPLVVGQAYRVMWNGTAYTSTAADLYGVAFIGNAAFSGLDGASDTGEPFAIAYFDGECAIFTLDAGDHTVAIYQEVEDVHASNDAVILSYSQNPVEYKAVPKVWLTHPDSTEEAPVLVPFTYGELLEGVEIMPDFAEGDMQISVPDGSLVKEATLVKPETLVPENVRYGTVIAGIEGKFLGDTEEATVALNMTDGDQVILPSVDGKTFSKVTVKKPETLIPENIVQGVRIGGVVGTYVGGGSAVVEKDINFYDYDGTLLYSYYLSDLPLSELPELPDHSRHHVPLTGVGWNFTLGQVNALTGPMNIGALYTPADGQTKICISLTDDNVKTFTLFLAVSHITDSGIIIDWGDGNTTTADVSISYMTNQIHTYESVGDYIISIKFTASRTLYMYSYNGEGTFGVYANTNRAILSTVKEIYVANHFGGVGIKDYAFAYCPALEILTLPTKLTNMGTFALRDCPNLKTFIYPNNAADLSGSTYVCGYDYSLKCVSIPPSVTGLGNYFFYYCYALKSVTLPTSVTAIGNYAFGQCRSMTKAVILGAATIGNYAFKACYGLTEFIRMGTGTSIGDYGLDECVALRKVVLPSNLKTIGQYALRYAYPMATLTIPASVTSIGAYAFGSCFGMKEYHFESTTPPTLAATTAFSGITSDCKIYVPSASLSAYKAAPNWSTYARYMVAV